MIAAENTSAMAGLISMPSSTGVIRPLIQPSVPSSAVATGIMRRHIRKKRGRPRLRTARPKAPPMPAPIIRLRLNQFSGFVAPLRPKYWFPIS